MNKNIILIGYMGSGKTTIAGELHKKTGWKVIDTDAAIVREQGHSINEIFAADGEAAFRDMETALLKSLSSQKENYILSTGGGMPVREENRKLLKELGSVFFLKAEPDTILDRIKDDTQRPLLKDPDRRSKVTKMLAERTPLYEDAAERIIVTDGKTAVAIADEIIRLCEEEQ